MKKLRKSKKMKWGNLERIDHDLRKRKREVEVEVIQEESPKEAKVDQRDVIDRVQRKEEALART